MLYAIALGILFVVSLSIIGWLIGRNRQEVNGIIVTTWSSYRSRALNYNLPDDSLERILSSEKPYYGYSFAGPRFDLVKAKILNSGEQVAAAFSVTAKSLDGYILVTDPQASQLMSFLVVTNQRLIIWHPSALEGKLLTFPYRDIKEIKIEKRMVYSSVTLRTEENAVVLESFPDPSGLFSYVVRKQMDLAGTSA